VLLFLLQWVLLQHSIPKLEDRHLSALSDSAALTRIAHNMIYSSSDYYCYCRDSSVGTATIWTSGFDSKQGQEIFLFSAIGLALRPTQPTVQWGSLSPELQRPGLKADYSPSSSAKVKRIVELYLHYPILLNGMALN
jgi:hypothetical protein